MSRPYNDFELRRLGSQDFVLLTRELLRNSQVERPAASQVASSEWLCRSTLLEIACFSYCSNLFDMTLDMGCLHFKYPLYINLFLVT